MKLNELITTKSRGKKRLGRGIGSGKGKTSGRGSKGQKARGKIRLSFSGDLSFYKKLPNRRGLGNPKVSPNPKTITLSSLNIFPAKATIDLEQLVKIGLISEKESRRGIKIVSGGEIKKALTIKVPISETAKEKVKKVGGISDV